MTYLPWARDQRAFRVSLLYCCGVAGDKVGGTTHGGSFLRGNPAIVNRRNKESPFQKSRVTKIREHRGVTHLGRADETCSRKKKREN